MTSHSKPKKFVNTYHKEATLLPADQASRQDLAAGGAKNNRGHFFQIQYWMYSATGRPNMEWGGLGTTAPLLAMALPQTNVDCHSCMYVSQGS